MQGLGTAEVLAERSKQLQQTPALPSKPRLNLSSLQVLTETLNFLAAAIQDFGLALFDVPALLAWAKADLGSSVAGTRTAAIAMVRLSAWAPRPQPLRRLAAWGSEL